MKLIFELDGSDHNLLNVQDHDKKRDKRFINEGYTVLRIKEFDWFEDKETQIQKVLETIKFLEQKNNLK